MAGDECVFLACKPQDEACDLLNPTQAPCGDFRYQGLNSGVTEHLPGQVVEVLAQPHDAAAAVLRRSPHVDDVQTFGERIHVRLSPAASSGEVDRLRAALVAAGVGDPGLRLVPTSLEDVFIARIGDAAR